MGKKYSSVLEMVDDLSSPKFAAKFRKSLKKRTIWVLLNTETNWIEVFKKFKSAKTFVKGIYESAEKPTLEKTGPIEELNGLVWESEDKKMKLFVSRLVGG